VFPIPVHMWMDCCLCLWGLCVFQVPKLWSKYVEEVDGEQQAWLNSFYKAPLRLPMPSELSYMWDKREAHPTHTPGTPHQQNLCSLSLGYTPHKR